MHSENRKATKTELVFEIDKMARFFRKPVDQDTATHYVNKLSKFSLETIKTAISHICENAKSYERPLPSAVEEACKKLERIENTTQQTVDPLLQSKIQQMRTANSNALARMKNSERDCFLFYFSRDILAALELQAINPAQVTQENFARLKQKNAEKYPCAEKEGWINEFDSVICNKERSYAMIYGKPIPNLRH